jgi:hypothetical protein
MLALLAQAATTATSATAPPDYFAQLLAALTALAVVLGLAARVWTTAAKVQAILNAVIAGVKAGLDALPTDAMSADFRAKIGEAAKAAGVKPDLSVVVAKVTAKLAPPAKPTKPVAKPTPPPLTGGKAAALLGALLVPLALAGCYWTVHQRDEHTIAAMEKTIANRVVHYTRWKAEMVVATPTARDVAGVEVLQQAELGRLSAELTYERAKTDAAK